MLLQGFFKSAHRKTGKICGDGCWNDFDVSAGFHLAYGIIVSKRYIIIFYPNLRFAILVFSVVFFFWFVGHWDSGNIITND